MFIPLFGIYIGHFCLTSLSLPPDESFQSIHERISDHTLRQALTRFGSIKEIKIFRSQAYAFLEFQHVYAANKAIKASDLWGGIWIDVGPGEQIAISVERRNGRV